MNVKSNYTLTLDSGGEPDLRLHRYRSLMAESRMMVV
jgi:hypothetical protein